MSTRDDKLSLMLKLVDRVSAPASKIDTAMQNVQGRIKDTQGTLKKFTKSLHELESWHSNLKIEEKFSSIGDEIVSIRDKAINLGKGLNSTSSEFGGFAQKLTNDIISSIESIDESTIKSVADDIGASVADAINSIASIGLPAVNMLSDSITGMNNIMTASSNAAGYIRTLSEDAINGVKNLKNASKKVTGFMSTLSTGAVKGLNILSSAFKKVAGVIGKIGMLIISNPILAIVGLIAAAAMLIISNWDTIVAWATPYWQKLSAIFSTAWENIKSFFLNWAPLGLFIQHWDAIVAWATPYWQNLSAIFSTAWEGIKSFFSSWNPITLFTQIWDNVTTYFSGLPARMAEAGRNIIAGLGQGIDEKLQWIKEKVSGLGEYLPTWLQKRLGIHSPSRVFAALGGFISEGLGVGIDDKSDAALNAVQRIGKRLPGALPTAMAIGLTATAAHASPVSAIPAGSTVGGQVVVHQYNTFHIQTQPGDDHQAIAKAIAAELDRRENQSAARRRSRLFDEV